MNNFDLLRKQLKVVYNTSPYYKLLWDQQNLHPDKINTPEDFLQVPFTTKENLIENNKDFLAVNMKEVRDIVITSGTTGKPIQFFLTENDLQRLAENEFQSLSQAGITSDDIVQLTATTDKMFMAGLAYVLGLRKIGASTIRVGPGVPDLQLSTMQELKSTALIAVPSFILKLIEHANKTNFDLNTTAVKKIICIGEPIRNDDFKLNQLGEKITAHWKVELYSTYASTEMSTAFTECSEHQGGHSIPQLIYVEVLNENIQQVEHGEIGEVVVTTLGVEGMPLVRYKTGDVCRVYHSKCKCGKENLRLGPVLGRKKQMIKYKGTTFYPNAINEIIYKIPFVTAHYTEVYHDEMGLDQVRVHVSLKENAQAFKNELIEKFKAGLRVTPEFVFETEEEVNAVKNSINFRKSSDFVDLRSKLD